jgi:hypothetical protein
MTATILQLSGLTAIVIAGVMTGAAAAVLALGLVALYVGLAVERD